MSLTLIAIGSIVFFLIRMYLNALDTSNPPVGFAVVFAAFPLLISSLLVLSTTSYQLIYLIKNKSHRTKVDILVFVLGCSTSIAIFDTWA